MGRGRVRPGGLRRGVVWRRGGLRAGPQNRGWWHRSRHFPRVRALRKVRRRGNGRRRRRRCLGFGGLGLGGRRGSRRDEERRRRHARRGRRRCSGDGRARQARRGRGEEPGRQREARGHSRVPSRRSRKSRNDARSLAGERRALAGDDRKRPRLRAHRRQPGAEVLWLGGMGARRRSANHGAFGRCYPRRGRAIGGTGCLRGRASVTRVMRRERGRRRIGCRMHGR